MNREKGFMITPLIAYMAKADGIKELLLGWFGHTITIKLSKKSTDMGTGKQKGLYGKYIIQKSNGKPIDEKAQYFILRYDKCSHSRKALEAYCESISKENPMLANDLRIELGLESKN
jgi:hypothetical protein